jgi:hypothetical protein
MVQVPVSINTLSNIIKRLLHTDTMHRAIEQFN